MMMIGTLAITGVGIPLLYIGFPIGFAGVVSKDAIIESAYAGTHGGYAFWMLVVAALMTSFDSWRLMFLTFYGTPRGDAHTHEHAHEAPNSMLVPLYVLAIGAVFSGMVWYGSFFGSNDKVGKFFGVPYAEASEYGEEADHGDDHSDDHAAEEGSHGKAHYNLVGAPGEGAIHNSPDNHVLNDAHEVPVWVKLAPFIAMLSGFGLAYQMYIRRPDWPHKLATQQAPLYQFLLNKWYFDEIFNFLIVKPMVALGRILWKQGDTKTIDGGINGLAMGIIPFFTRLAGRAQSGYIFSYAFAMVLGIAALLTWMTLFGGAN
jgi:NADH-quinone oxidoreductase subunit L